jgi:competence protein ComEC
MFTRARSFGVALGILVSLNMGVLFSQLFSVWEFLLTIWGISLLFGVIWHTQKYSYSFLLCVLIGLCCGGVRLLWWNPIEPAVVQTLYDVPHVYTGVITSFPELKQNEYLYTVKLYEVDGELMEIPFKVKITTPRHIYHVRAEHIQLYGAIEAPFDSLEFSYKAYLARKYIFGIMRVSHMQDIEDPTWYWDALGSLRYRLQASIYATYRYPYGGFLEGLLLGRKYGLSPELSDVFQTTGLTHIIAISGYNITLVILIMTRMFSFLGRYAQIICSIIAVILFTILVGAEASVVRACLMGLVALAGLYFGRQTMVWNGLVWAMVFMTWYEPRTFLFDVGFQLSVVATIGVVALSKHTGEWFSFLPVAFEIRESFALTIAAQITTLPLLIFYFQNISTVSPLANVLVAPFLPWAMCFGFLGAVFSFVPLLPDLLFLLTESLLRIVVFLASWCADIPYALIKLPQISVVWMVLFYIGLVWFLVSGSSSD